MSESGHVMIHVDLREVACPCVTHCDGGAQNVSLSHGMSTSYPEGGNNLTLSQPVQKCVFAFTSLFVLNLQW